MKRIAAAGLLLGLALVLVSCASKAPAPPPQMPNVSGAWEFILNSTSQPGYATGLEVWLQEGQSLVDGYYEYTGQISASGTQISFVGFTPSGIVFGGNCAPAADNTGNSLSGSISGVGGSMNFTFTESGNVFTVNAILDASGQFIDSGTYTSQSGSSCTDSGIISSGKIVPKLSGMYAGKLLVNANNDSATATLSESSGTLTMNLLLTGPDNASLTLTGPVTGNAFFVQGTFDGAEVSYYGYFESTASVPTLYLSTVASPSEQAGVLKGP